MYRSFIGGSSYTTFNPDLRPQTNWAPRQASISMVRNCWRA
jgi:hypothetical protein